MGTECIRYVRENEYIRISPTLGGVVKFTVIPVKTGIHIRLERDSFLNLATCGFRPVSENPEYRVDVIPPE